MTNYGYTQTEEHKKKISKSNIGKSRNKKEANPNWKGGVAEYENHHVLKKNRIELLKRANGRCEICKEPAHEIHHVDESKVNHNLDNLMVLCKNCHLFLHANFNNRGERTKSTSKYVRKYGMTLKEIAKKFNVTSATIWHWTKSPEKEDWLKKQLGIQ